MLQDFLDRNLEFLSRHLGAFDLVKKALKVYNPSVYSVDEAKDGSAILTYKGSDSRSINYHSRYNPIREAEQVVAAAYNGESHALLIGSGMAYTASIVLEKLPNLDYGPQLFILEPDPFVFISALKYRDLTKLLADKRVVIFLGTDVDRIGEEWDIYFDWATTDGLAVIEHQPSKSRFADFFNRFFEKLKYLANRSKGNLVTLMNVGSEFHTNNFINLPEAFFTPGAERLFDKFNGVPAVIVAAGPSLDKNLPFLKRVKGRFPIIAVDTALRHMIATGIKPDIVCAADSSYENSLDFVGVEDEKEVILAAELMTHPDIFRVFKGPKLLVSFGGGLYPQIAKFREPAGNLICWGSVATTAFDLARKIGADPIIFIGLDLSFCDGRLHARGSYSDDILFEKLHPFTSIENETAEYIAERGRFQFKGSDGTFIYTDANMKAYKEWFEDQFRQTPAKIINATEGGIVHDYVELISLNAAIDKYFDKGVDVHKILMDSLSEPVKVEPEALIKKLREIRNRIGNYDDLIKKVSAYGKHLKDNFSDKTDRDLNGTDLEKFTIVMNLHDKICDDAEIVQWFAALHTKFVTKHSSNVIKIRNKKNVTIGQWMSLVDALFENFAEFSAYQLPLVDNALLELSEKCVKI